MSLHEAKGAWSIRGVHAAQRRFAASLCRWQVDHDHSWRARGGKRRQGGLLDFVLDPEFASSVDHQPDHPSAIAQSTKQPLTYWETLDGSPWTGGSKSSIAPSGMAFYTGDGIAEWKGNLFVGALACTALWRLVLDADGKAVVSRERHYATRSQRIRDVRQGPDGWLYLLTDGVDGKVLRIQR